MGIRIQVTKHLRDPQGVQGKARFTEANAQNQGTDQAINVEAEGKHSTHAHVGYSSILA